MALSNPVWQDIYFLYHHSILVTQVATSTVSLGKMIWQDTGNYIKSAVSTAGSYIKSAVNSAKNYVKSAVNSAKTYVKNAVSSVKSYVGGSSYKGGNYSSLSDLMSPEEAARYEAYFTKDAPDMVIPGTRELEGIHLHHNSLTDVDEIQPWKAYYDDYGRLMARTDYNAGNKAAEIPDIHYHLYEWGKGFGDWKKPHEYASHLEGEFR